MNGNGTQESPYEITTFEEFNGVKEQNAYYKLINNIDCHMASNVKVRTNYSPTNPSLFAHIDLNGKNVICPVFNDSDRNAAMFESLYITNGNILDIYPISTITMYGEYGYIFCNTQVEDVAVSVHFSPPHHLDLGTGTLFTRCNIKLSGEVSESILYSNSIAFTDCKITFNDFITSKDNASINWNANYSYICGKVKFTGQINDSSRYLRGLFVFDSRGSYNNQNILNVEFSGNFENETYIVNLGSNTSFNNYMVVNTDSLGTKVKANDFNKVTSAELLSPSVLKSKGMQINEVS